MRSSSLEHETKVKNDRSNSNPERRQARQRLSPLGRSRDFRFRFAPLDDYELLRKPPKKLNLSDDIILEEEASIRQEGNSPSLGITLPVDLGESWDANQNRLGPLADSIEELESEHTAPGISIKRDTLISKL